MNDKLAEVVAFLDERHDIGDKTRLCSEIVEHFGLTKDRSVYYCRDFAVRFSSAKSQSFSNTVLSLSNLQKFDDRPFLVVLVTPGENFVFLANTTLLKKISHSSQELRENNIRGSFNGSDISRDLDGISNNSRNLRQLFDIHAEIGFEGNLARLVEATNNISPTGSKFEVSDSGKIHILQAPERAVAFMGSNDAPVLKAELDAKVDEFRNEILLASLIENVNVRGRVIEYLIAGEDEQLRQSLVDALLRKEGEGLPQFKTENALGDYTRVFDRYHTETDVKTKIMVLSSNPKAYNIDKILAFLAEKDSVFLFYFVGVDPSKIVNQVLVSMFQSELLDGTVTLRHWAGRNSRGVTQFDGRVIHNLVLNDPRPSISVEQAKQFLEMLIEL